MQNDRPPVALLGVPFDNVTMAETLTAIKTMVASRRPHYIATANVDFLVQARTDVELHRILCEAHLVLCDGTPVLWASRLLGRPLPERVAGADLVPKLIGVAAQERYRVFLLGATLQAAEQAATRLQAQYPGVVIAGYYSPPFRKLLEMDHAEIKRQITQARPDLLLVAFGCPKQEKWLAMHYRELGVPVAIGVGATIDFLAGQVKRAPTWMQHAGIEWVFRLAQEPRRLFRRYLRDLGVFGWALLGQWFLLKLLAPRPWSPGALPQPCAAAGQFALDLSEVKSLDSAGVAALMRLQRRFTAANHALCLVGLQKQVRRALQFMHAADFFLIASDLEDARAMLTKEAQARRVQVEGKRNEQNNQLVWRGEITAATSKRVWHDTLAALAGPPPRPQWEIDLTEVRFIDSSGLGLMVRLKQYAEGQAQQLRFSNVQPAVRNVLRLAELESALLGRPTARDARLEPAGQLLAPAPLVPTLAPELAPAPTQAQPG